MEAPFSAYVGDGPYIFVSYAHEDGDLVYPELERLKAEGFNIWYDEGIAPGSIWRDELAERLAACALLVFFVTPATLRSAHQSKEVNFALARDRPILTIYLAQVSLPPGLEFSLSDVQAIHKSKLEARDYHTKLHSSIDRLLPTKVSHIHGFRIIRLLHHSKTYSSFVAFDDFLNRQVEIVLLGEDIDPSSPEALRLVDEATLLARVDNRNFQAIYASGVWEGKRYLVLEHGLSTDEMNLNRILSSVYGGIPLYYTLNWVLQIAEIIDVMSNNGTEFKALQPHMFSLRASGEIFLRYPWETEPTPVDNLYASPEELNGEVATRESNYYSLGILLHEMVTGQLPYSANVSPEERVAQIQENIRELRTTLAFDPDPDRPALMFLSQRNNIRQKLIDLLEGLLNPYPKERLFLEKVMDNGGPYHKKKSMFRRLAFDLLSEIDDDPEFIARLEAQPKDVPDVPTAVLEKTGNGIQLSDAEAELYLVYWNSCVEQRLREWNQVKSDPDLAPAYFTASMTEFCKWMRQDINQALWEGYKSDYFPADFVTFIDKQLSNVDEH